MDQNLKKRGDNGGDIRNGKDTAQWKWIRIRKSGVTLVRTSSTERSMPSGNGSESEQTVYTELVGISNY